MGTAVMPLQVQGRHAQSQRVIQDAVQVIQLQIFHLRAAAREKRGRRHLLRIAHDHGVLRPVEGARRLAGGQLRRLVKDHDVKQVVLLGEVLGHGVRAHQHARAQRGKNVGDAVKQLPDRHPSGAAADGFPEEGKLQSCFRRGPGGGHPGDQLPQDLCPGLLHHRVVHGPELPDRFLKRGAGKAAQYVVAADGLADQRAVYALPVGVRQLLRFHAAFIGFHHRHQTGSCALLPDLVVQSEVFQRPRVPEKQVTELPLLFDPVSAAF